jgi:ribosomal protein S18 acetylase RimI-like enzyme
MHGAAGLGEIYMIAVDPRAQREGVGSALAAHALEHLKRSGASVAMVETGGDTGHAPARRAYERLGFRELPISRYFRKL